MNVIGLSGSPRKNANTDRLVCAILDGARGAGADTEFLRLADLDIKGCAGCLYCRIHETCFIRDDMQSLYQKLHSADAVVVGSPVYMGQMTSQTKQFTDRLFPLVNADFTTRLKKRPQLVLAFTQGQPDAAMFRPYMENTRQIFGFLGFAAAEIIVGGGTRGTQDIMGQDDLLQKARATGTRLASGSLPKRKLRTRSGTPNGSSSQL